MTGQKAGLEASLVTAIPWTAALVGVIVISRLANRGRSPHALAAMTLLFSGAGILGSAFFLRSPVPALILLSVAAIGFVSAQPIFWQLPTRYLSGAALAGATGLINALGNLGGWLAPNLRTWAAQSAWGSPEAPNEAAGLIVLGLAGFIGLLLIVGLRLFPQSEEERASLALQAQDA